MNNSVPRSKEKPTSMDDRLDDLKCHMCGEHHMFARPFKSPKYGLCWKFDSPCHTAMNNRMTNAFNLLAKKSGLF